MTQKVRAADDFGAIRAAHALIFKKPDDTTKNLEGEVDTSWVKIGEVVEYDHNGSRKTLQIETDGQVWAVIDAFKNKRYNIKRIP